jgi:L-seryl-tRNA(Ser) seleniumtransferase
MFSLTPEDIGRRAKKAAQTLRKTLPDLAVSVEPGESQVGSGAVPVETLATKVLTLKATNVSAEELSKKLRRAEPPVFARILKDALLFDFRTIQPGEDAVLIRILIDLLK